MICSSASQSNEKRITGQKDCVSKIEGIFAFFRHQALKRFAVAPSVSKQTPPVVFIVKIRLPYILNGPIFCSRSLFSGWSPQPLADSLYLPFLATSALIQFSLLFPYFPLYSGFLFSKNAFTPSCASLVSKILNYY